MLLENKNAVIYGAGGAIGGAVARAFALEGAKVFLAGRTLEKVNLVAKEISSMGGIAETAEVDALDCSNRALLFLFARAYNSVHKLLYSNALYNTPHGSLLQHNAV